MFKLQDMLKEEDGYHIVTIHAKDTAFREAIVRGMKDVGYEPYSFSQHEDNSIQYAFVTAAKKKELHERHLHSCRNSLGSAEEVLGKKPGILDGIVGRLRARLGKQEKVDDFFAIHHATEVEPDHYTVVVGKERTPQPGDRKYVELNIETNRSFSELRAEDLERQQRERRTAPPEAFDDSAVRESYPPRHYIDVFAPPARPARHEGRAVDASENRARDDDDYSRRSSPTPISDPSPPSDYGSDGGGSTD